MEYTILEEDNSYSLGEEVNKKIAEGWELYGSPSVCCTSYLDDWKNVQFSYTYIQAMVKRTAEKEKES